MNETFDLAKYIADQKEWSARTFGPGPRTLGLIEHIKSELVEIDKAPSDLFEWVDVMILAFDGAWRAGWIPEYIVDALQKKQVKNFARTWSAPCPQDKPNFHVKARTEDLRPIPDAVPDPKHDTLYAKMKKRLEELRAEAVANSFTRQARDFSGLLSDLEAYAKEGKS